MISRLLLAGVACAALSVPAVAQVSSGAAPSGSTAGATSSSPSTAPAGRAATPNMPGTTSATPGSGAAPTTTPPAVNDPVPSGSTANSAAATGSATNTAATASDLRAGAAVKDSAGVSLGTISKVTPGKTGGASTVTLTRNGKTVSIPSTALTMSNGALVSESSEADVWSK